MLEPASGAHAEAFSALIALGYKPIEVTRLLKAVEPSVQTTEEIIRRALQAAAAAYSDFELDQMPVVADPAAAPALSAMGGRFLRRYCQGIWLRDGQPALYRHVDRFYTRLLDRAERRGAQQTPTATESTRIA